MKLLKLYYLYFISVIFLFGCATPLPFLVEIDTVTDKGKGGLKNYVLLPANEGVSINDLRYKEYANYVKVALMKQGFVETDIDSADIAIYFSYGMGDPEIHSYSYTYPIYGKISGSTTNVRVKTNYSDGSSSTTYGTAKSKPKYGVTGYGSYSGTRKVYFRFITLEAVDLNIFKESNEVINVWQTNITSSGSTNDLRVVMPIMIAGAIPYIGKDTEKKIGIKVRENNYEVLQIKGIKVNEDVRK